MKSLLNLILGVLIGAGSVWAQDQDRVGAAAQSVSELHETIAHAAANAGTAGANAANSARSTTTAPAESLIEKPVHDFRNRVLTSPSTGRLSGDRGGNGIFSPERPGGDRGGNGEAGPLLSNIMFIDMSPQGSQGYICGGNVQIAEFVDWMISEPYPMWRSNESVKTILSRVVDKVRREAPIPELIDALEFTAFRVHLVEAGNLPRLEPSPIEGLEDCFTGLIVNEAVFESYTQNLVFSSPYMNQLDNMNKAGLIVSTVLRSIVIDGNQRVFLGQQLNRLVAQLFTDVRLNEALMRTMFMVNTI